MTRTHAVQILDRRMVRPHLPLAVVDQKILGQIGLNQNYSVNVFPKSLRKQQLRDILLKVYVLDLINFTNLCSLLATFFNTLKTFQHCLNVAVRMIRRRDVGQRQINVETTLCISTLKFTTLNNVRSTLSISTLI